MALASDVSDADVWLGFGGMCLLVNLAETVRAGILMALNVRGWGLSTVQEQMLLDKLRQLSLIQQ